MPGIHYKMRIALCDDSDLERDILRKMLEKYLDAHLLSAQIDEYTSGEALLKADVASYNLFVLDVIMDAINGIETAQRLHQLHPHCQIIFCSSSREYAAESYDVAALRYIIKPVSEEKLFLTLDRYFHAYAAMRTLVYKQNRMDEHIYLSDLLWIEAGDHKCILHTTQGDITTRSSFTGLWEQLDGMDFVRPIRYAIVSLAEVVAIPTDVLTLRDGSTIPIARAMREDMKKAYSHYKMQSLLKKGSNR